MKYYGQANDKDRLEVGLVAESVHYTFILKFFMYDAVSADYDYPIA